MKITFLILISFTSIFIYGQTTYTYKPNPITGNLEVFKTSQGNKAYPQRVAEIVRNPISGYLEIKEYSTDNQVQQSSSDPYTNRPNFELVKQIKAYDPYSGVIEQINTLNKRTENNLIQRERNNITNSTPKSEYYNKQLRDYLQNISTTANKLLSFYNAQAKFPSKLPDGYYLTTEIQDGTSIKINNVLDPNNKINGDKEIQVGIAYIQNNKLVEYFESSWFDKTSSTSNVFRKFNISVASNVVNCKVMFREEMTNEYRSLYFFDNILDSSSRIPNPNFGYFTLFTDGLVSDSEKPIGLFGIKMGRQPHIPSSESIYEYFSNLPYANGIDHNNNSKKYNCSNSNLTFAFKVNAGKYCILVYNIEKRNGKNDTWYYENIEFTPGNCASTILKTN
jgi:hypothetical protein